MNYPQATVDEIRNALAELADAMEAIGRGHKIDTMVFLCNAKEAVNDAEKHLDKEE